MRTIVPSSQSTSGEQIKLYVSQLTSSRSTTEGRQLAIDLWQICLLLRWPALSLRTQAAISHLSPESQFRKPSPKIPGALDTQENQGRERYIAMIMMMVVVRIDHKIRHIFAARSPVLCSEHTRAVNAHPRLGPTH